MTAASLPRWYRRPGRLLAVLAGLALLACGGWYGGRQAWGAYHWRRAREAADRRDFMAALDHLARCRALWPASAEVYLESARAARRAGRLDEAEDFLHACCDRQGAGAETSREWLFLAARRGRFLELEEDLRAGLKPGRPDWLLTLEVLTGELMRANRLLEAKAYLDRWVACLPDDVEGWLRRAWVLEHLLDLDGARADYEQVLARAPERHAVRLHLAEILVQAKRVREARPHLEVLEQHLPEDHTVRLCRARCEHLMGNVQVARDLLDALLRDFPHDGQALGERGLLALGEGEVEQAEALLRQACEAAPHDQAVHFNLLRCLERRGKTEEAARVRAELERIDSDRHRMGDLVLEIMRRPRDADLRCEAAGIFLRNGLREDGRRWLETALEVDPRHPGARRALARYYEEEGRLDLAARLRQGLPPERTVAPGSR
jgi:tetratricopeptide (TPR) repeat protein